MGKRTAAKVPTPAAVERQAPPEAPVAPANPRSPSPGKAFAETLTAILKKQPLDNRHRAVAGAVREIMDDMHKHIDAPATESRDRVREAIKTIRETFNVR